MTANIIVKEGDKDEDTSQWLSFTFEKKKKVVLPNLTLQQAITKEPRKMKKEKTICHLSRIGSGEVVGDIATPIQAESESSP